MGAVISMLFGKFLGKYKVVAAGFVVGVILVFGFGSFYLYLKVKTLQARGVELEREVLSLEMGLDIAEKSNLALREHYGEQLRVSREASDIRYNTLKCSFERLLYKYNSDLKVCNKSVKVVIDNDTKEFALDSPGLDDCVYADFLELWK
jgi:hypothetical protein